jgi:hypothetical protein
MSLEEQMMNKINKNNLNLILENFHLEELEIQNLNKYYKLVLNFFQITLVLVIIVPWSYPKRYFVCYLVNLSSRLFKLLRNKRK